MSLLSLEVIKDKKKGPLTDVPWRARDSQGCTSEALPAPKGCMCPLGKEQGKKESSFFSISLSFLSSSNALTKYAYFRGID